MRSHNARKEKRQPQEAGHVRGPARGGASKEKAARISNAAARDGKSKVAERGGESPSYDDWTVSELKKRAKELGLTNYSAKKKSELITALRNH